MLEYPAALPLQGQPSGSGRGVLKRGEYAAVLGFVNTLSPGEREIMRAELSAQIGRYFDDKNQLAMFDESTHKRFNLLAMTLRELAQCPAGTPANGIAYYGRPGWLSPQLLEALNREAIQRRHRPLDRIDHFLGCGGTVADALSVAPAVLEFVSSQVGPCRATGVASYLYYDRPGLGIRPHVDTSVFTVNLMLMLSHSGVPPSARSATLVFPANSLPEHYRLEVGEAMIMHGSSVIHARSLVGMGEVVRLLTIGYHCTSLSSACLGQNRDQT